MQDVFCRGEWFFQSTLQKDQRAGKHTMAAPSSVNDGTIHYSSPDQIQLIIPGVDIQNRPNSNHVVVTAPDVLNVLMLQRHLGEELKFFRSLLENLLCCVEAIHQQRPAACSFVFEAVEHLDPARRERTHITKEASVSLSHDRE